MLSLVSLVLDTVVEKLGVFGGGVQVTRVTHVTHVTRVTRVTHVTHVTHVTQII